MPPSSPEAYAGLGLDSGRGLLTPTLTKKGKQALQGFQSTLCARDRSRMAKTATVWLGSREPGSTTVERAQKMHKVEAVGEPTLKHRKSSMSKPLVGHQKNQSGFIGSKDCRCEGSFYNVIWPVEVRVEEGFAALPISDFRKNAELCPNWVTLAH